MLKDHERNTDYKSLANDLGDMYEIEKNKMIIPDTTNLNEVVRINKDVLGIRVLWAHDSAMMQARAFIYTLVGHAVAEKGKAENLLSNIIKNEVYFLAGQTKDEFEELKKISEKGNYNTWLVRYMRGHIDMMTKEAFKISLERVKKALKNIGVKGVDDVSLEM